MRARTHCCVLAYLVIYSWFVPATASAVAIAVAGGAVKVSPATAPVAGAGAACAGVQFGSVGVLVGPGVVGATYDGIVPCSDMVMVGGKPLISTTTTTAIGRTIARNNPNVVGAFSGQGAKLGTTALQIGENFSYNRKTTNNKAAGAIGQTAGVTDPKGSIGSASASIALNNGVATGTSTASVKRVALDPLPGVAVGLVNDPVTVTPDTSSPSTSVSVTIGSPGNLLSLQASDVSDSASVLYELAEGDQMLLALEIDLDNTTSSLQNVGFTFLAFDPVDLGFGSMSQSDYLKNVLLPFLTFDDSSHTLSETAPILVSNGPFLLSGTNSVDFTWNYGAVAGATVPEPPSALLILSGLGSLIASKALRSRTCWNCAGK